MHNLDSRTKGIIAGIVCLVLFFGVIGLGSVVKSNAPAPTPTPMAAVTVVGLGGPLLNDPDVRAVLAEPWADKMGEIPPIVPDTRFANTATAKMNAWNADPAKGIPYDYRGIDFVWEGDTYYASQFPVKPHTSQVVFNTKLGMFTWWRHLEAFEKGGYAYREGSSFIMPIEKACALLQYQYEGKTWREAGIVFDDDRFSDSLVDLNGSDPVSSTGIEQMAFMANCFANNGQKPADISQFDVFMPQLIAYAHQQGAQGKGSLASFNEFLSNGEGTVAFVAYDSAYPTVGNENGWPKDLIKCISSDPKTGGNCKKENRLVMIYFARGTSASHTFIPLTENGRLLLRRFADPRLQKIVWEKLGMTTPATFLYDAPISWMSTTVQMGDKPRDEVYAAIISALNAEFAQKK